MKEVGPRLIGIIIGNISETTEDRPNALTSHSILSSWSIFKYMCYVLVRLRLFLWRKIRQTWE